jgi:hypothetical protein
MSKLKGVYSVFLLTLQPLCVSMLNFLTLMTQPKYLLLDSVFKVNTSILIQSAGIEVVAFIEMHVDSCYVCTCGKCQQEWTTLH